MENKSCCFTGHRDIRPEKVPLIKEKLREILTEYIEKGFTDFYNGGAYGFDMLSAETVIELKENYPYIRLHIIIPCADHTKPWNTESVSRFEKITALADEVKCLSPYYFNGCMQIRNRYMVDNSSHCIAYVTNTSGGSAGTVKYAEKQGKEVVNIFDMI